ncbi:MAG: hypothetical protein PF637_07625 [Spirochaetes bacterium]|jgi:uncharacterized protein YlbG (UPF0298 family)|nr:hypothetical protein [Spirochaetota bacterium]
MIHGHDIRYKKLFSNVELLEQLVRTFVAEPFVADLDFSEAVKIDKSFISAIYTLVPVL